eukprot:m.139436 g.139436  ORF g.139436 m.139436 type:complete len:892 (-) comp16088_c1_seq4:276-2951(-)
MADRDADEAMPNAALPKEGSDASSATAMSVVAEPAAAAQPPASQQPALTAKVDSLAEPPTPIEQLPELVAAKDSDPNTGPATSPGFAFKRPAKRSAITRGTTTDEEDEDSSEAESEPPVDDDEKAQTDDSMIAVASDGSGPPHPKRSKASLSDPPRHHRPKLAAAQARTQVKADKGTISGSDHEGRVEPLRRRGGGVSPLVHSSVQDVELKAVLRNRDIPTASSPSRRDGIVPPTLNALRSALRSNSPGPRGRLEGKTLESTDAIDTMPPSTRSSGSKQAPAQAPPKPGLSSAVDDPLPSALGGHREARPAGRAKAVASMAEVTRNHGWDNEKDDYIIQEDEILTNRYRVLGLLGKGSFGQVVKAHDLHTDTHVAIKIIKNRRPFERQARIEISLLQHLNAHDPDDKKCIVRFLQHFKHKNHLCLVFELLSFDLYELIRRTKHHGVSLRLVRKFAYQVLTAVSYLTERGVIHCDLKPENILLVGPHRSAVKVIDFGSSCQVDQTVYQYIQSRFYRSPEVILGLPYTQQIDMWSLGCILVELLVGNPLFNGRNEKDQLYKMIEALGMPPPPMAAVAKKTDQFFNRLPSGELGLHAREATNYQPPGRRSISALLRETYAKKHEKLQSDDDGIEQFIDLISKMLVYEPSKRVTCLQAVTHPFFSRFHTEAASSTKPKCQGASHVTPSDALSAIPSSKPTTSSGLRSSDPMSSRSGPAASQAPPQSMVASSMLPHPWGMMAAPANMMVPPPNMMAPPQNMMAPPPNMFGGLPAGLMPPTGMFNPMLASLPASMMPFGTGPMPPYFNPMAAGGMPPGLHPGLLQDPNALAMLQQQQQQQQQSSAALQAANLTNLLLSTMNFPGGAAGGLPANLASNPQATAALLRNLSSAGLGPMF